MDKKKLSSAAIRSIKTRFDRETNKTTKTMLQQILVQQEAWKSDGISAAPDKLHETFEGEWVVYGLYYTYTEGSPADAVFEYGVTSNLDTLLLAERKKHNGSKWLNVLVLSFPLNYALARVILANYIATEGSYVTNVAYNPNRDPKLTGTLVAPGNLAPYIPYLLPKPSILE